MMAPREQAHAMIAALRSRLGDVSLEIGALHGIQTDGSSMWARTLAPATDPAGLLSWAGFHQVRHGAQILIRPDPARSHPWLLVDDIPVADALRFAERRAAIVVETSPGNCQLRVLADRILSEEERKLAQRALCAHLGGDEDSTAGDKWGRLPGFRNQKPDRPMRPWTNLLRANLTERLVSADALLGEGSSEAAGPVGPVGLAEDHQAVAAPALLSPPGAGRIASAFSPARPGRSPIRGTDRSKIHFAFACHALRRGENPPSIARKIAERALQDGKRPDESSAVAYAFCVVAAAQANLRQ